MHLRWPLRWKPGKQNVRILLLSFLAATVFWFFNALNKTYSTKLDHPIQFNYNNNGLIEVEELPSSITMDVSGGGWNLFRKYFLFNVEPIKIYLNNPTQQTSIPVEGLLETISDQLSELDINFIYTDTFRLRIENIVSRKVAVKLDTTGFKLREGFVLDGKIHYVPDSVEFKGPESTIMSLPTIYEVPFSLTRIDEDINQQIPVPVSSPHLVSSPPNLTVHFNVDELIGRSVKKSIDKVNFPKGITLMDSLVEFSYAYPESMQDQFELDSISITADYGALNTSDSSIILQVENVPHFFHNYSIDIDSVRIFYE